MATFYPKYDYDPNVTKEAVVGEPHTIPTAAPYEIYLKHIPRQESPSTVSISGASTTWVEVTDPPAASGEFRVDYAGGLGKIIFHSSDAGKSITVNYNACGTVVWAETYPDGREGINKIQEIVETHTHTAAQVGAVPTTGGTMTGALKLPDGGATAPALAFANEPDTGIYRAGADILAFAAGGAERFRIDTAGPKVGTNKVWHAGNDGAASGLDADMVDGMHASALGPNWVQPGDTVLLSAPTERSRSDPDYAACKRLQVVRPGRYRITGEARISNGSGTAYINICAVALGGYEAAGNAVDVGSWSTNSTTYVAFAIDMSAAVPELGVIVVEIRSSSTSYTAYIRNVQVKYADGGSAPSPAVLQN